MLLLHVIIWDKSHLIHLGPQFPYLLSLLTTLLVVTTDNNLHCMEIHCGLIPPSPWTSLDWKALLPLLFTCIFLPASFTWEMLDSQCSSALYVSLSQNTNHTGVWWSSVPLEGRNCFCLFVFSVLASPVPRRVSDQKNVCRTCLLGEWMNLKIRVMVQWIFKTLEAFIVEWVWGQVGEREIDAKIFRETRLEALPLSRLWHLDLLHYEDLEPSLLIGFGSVLRLQ